MMRKKVGLLFLYNYKTWAGGVIYVINIVKALNVLEEHEKPKLIIFHSINSPIEDLKKINYPYIQFYLFKLNRIQRVTNHISVRFFLKSFFYKELPDVIYPYSRAIPVGKTPIHWIADLQEHHLPQMFPKEEVESRKSHQKNLSKTNAVIVFSSETAKKDFIKFYPAHKNKLKILNFASSLSNDFKSIDINSLRERYKLGNKYFFSPNQFWKHKNHPVILKAIKYLKHKELDFQIVFSGNNVDYRNKEYFQSLNNYIKENELDRWIRFLGFMERGEQLQLMNNAMAVIQPSLFEGWSTVVEEVKAMNQFIIVSDLEVHREQISENCVFFNPDDFEQLAILIENAISDQPSKSIIDYSYNVLKFAKEFMEIVSF